MHIQAQWATAEMRFLLLFILAASPVYACCPVDKDTFADEVPDPALLNEIAGAVPRNFREYWTAELDKAKRMELTGFRRALLSADALDRSGRPASALDKLQPWLSRPLAPQQKDKLNRLRMQTAMDLWWKGGSDRYPPDDCLRIAEESLSGPVAPLMKYVIDWAKAAEKADPKRYLPDFFNLRYATDKTVDHDTGELERRKLQGAEAFLLRQLRRSSTWENFDTFYALNLVYVVSGRQNLAYYTRLRCWSMHAEGRCSKVPGAAEIADIKALTILRRMSAGVLVPVKVVSDENQQAAKAQFNARTAWSEKWLQARKMYFKRQTQTGNAPDAPDFWAGFEPPLQDFPPLRAAAPEPLAATSNTQPKPPSAAPDANDETPPESAEKRESSRTVTWITLGILAAVLALGMLAKSRMNRAKPADDGEPKEKEA
jgi:hypothetical protein